MVGMRRSLASLGGVVALAVSASTPATASEPGLEASVLAEISDPSSIDDAYARDDFEIVVESGQSVQSGGYSLGPRPPWGTCPWNAKFSKVVYDYGSIVLQCGDSKMGLEHISDRHRSEFKTLAAMGNLQWQDIVHWAIYYNQKDPDHTKVNQSDGCRDRVLKLVNKRNGQVVWTKRFMLIYGASTGRVVTVYPTSRVC